MYTSNQQGFALPFTIFMVTFMTLILGAAFARTASEHLVAQSSQHQVTAISIAQSGLDAFFHDTMTIRPPSGDSIRYNVAGGYAWVFSDEIQKPADTVANPITYVIKSIGYVIEPNQGVTPQAIRTVAQFAQWQAGNFPVLAAFTAANELDIESDGISAIYAAPTCGIGVPVPRGRAPSGGIQGSLDLVSGLPSQVADSPDSVATWTDIDWSTLDAGAFLTDYNSVQLGDSTYSSQQVSNDLTITVATSGDIFGTGLLIVPRNLTVSGLGTFRWYGVILVGGRAQFRPSDTFIYGTVITGLDEGLGINVSDSHIGGHNDTPSGDQDRNFSLSYDPCEISRTMAPYSGFRRVDNTWIDNWSTY